MFAPPIRIVDPIRNISRPISGSFRVIIAAGFQTRDIPWNATSKQIQEAVDAVCVCGVAPGKCGCKACHDAYQDFLSGE